MDTPNRKISANGSAGLPSPSVLRNSAAAPGPSAAVANEINTINTVAVKLPELWQSKVCSRFAQAKAKFVTSGVTMPLTKYYHVIKALQESFIECIPELLVPPADDPYSVLKRGLIKLYNLSDYERAKLLMALPQVDGDMCFSMLLDKMRALTPPGELEQPTSLSWYAFLSRLLPDIRVHCVLFVGVEMLADVARRADAQFQAQPRPVAPPQVCSVPQE